MTLIEPVPLSSLAGPPAAPADRLDAVLLRRAAERPDAVALRSATGQLSYAGLLSRSAALASALHARGVGAGDVVGLQLRRGPDLVVAMLAVLRCGAAYAGIPVSWPTARRDDLARTAGLLLCLTDGTAGDPACPTVRIDDLRSRGAVLPEPATDADAPCCVFLTSGSTGVPKVAVAPHRAITRMDGDPAHGIDAGTVMVQAAAAGWDVFALEVWLPLMAGGSVVLTDVDQLTGADLRRAIDLGANSAALTAAVLSGLAEDDPDVLSRLRLLVTGGERASAAHLAACLRASPRLRLVHAYGPVENAVAGTAYVVPADLPADRDVPIGRPVAGTDAYVLDPELRCCPTGEVGQLALAGDGLALGYLGRPEATRDRFPTLPLGAAGRPVRVYLTGDLVRVDEAGELRFVGRNDRQLKVRGNRVEPGEVERALEQQPGIWSAHVLGLTDAAGRVWGLGACCVPVPGGPEPQPDEVRAAIGAQLPPAFVPDAIAFLPSLPMTPNAKVDTVALERLLALPAPPSSASPSLSVPESNLPESSLPESSLPESVDDPRLARVLDELLVLLGTPAGPDADIFAAGATSLTALRLVNRLGRRGAGDLDPAVVLSARTPRRIAAALRRPDEGTPEAVTADSTLLDVRRPTRLQAQHWLRERLAPGSADSVTPLVLRVHGSVSHHRLAAAVRTVVARHEALRTVFPVEHGRPELRLTGVDDLPALIDLAEPVDDLGAALTVARELLTKPFRLGRQLPVRGALVPIGTEGHDQLLVCSFHHVCFDLWSLDVFLADLAAAYRGEPLGPVTSFVRTSHEQERAVAPDRRDAAVEFWAERLTGVDPLPLRVPPNPMSTGPVREVSVAVSTALHDAAVRVAGGHATTSSAVYLAAFVGALRDVTGAETAAVTVPVAARSEAADEVIGCFAEHLLLGFRDLTDPAELLRQAAEQLFAAMTQPPPTHEALFGRQRRPLTGWVGYAQARFAVQESGAALPDLGTTVAELVPLGQDASSLAISLEVWPSRQQALLRCRTDLLTDDIQDRLAASWSEQLRALVDLLAEDC